MKIECVSLSNDDTDRLVQDEERLLCRIATTHDASLGAQLMHTSGWATLQTILQQM